MSQAMSETAIEAAVDSILATREWPIYETYDDNGLERDGYVRFAKDVIAALAAAQRVVGEDATKKLSQNRFYVFTKDGRFFDLGQSEEAAERWRKEFYETGLINEVYGSGWVGSEFTARVLAALALSPGKIEA